VRVRFGPSGGGATPMRPGRQGGSSRLSPLLLVLATFGAVASSSVATAVDGAVPGQGEVGRIEPSAPGPSVPPVGPEVPLAFAAAPSGLDLVSPPSRPARPVLRSVESGDHPGHRLRIERPPRHSSG